MRWLWTLLLAAGGAAAQSGAPELVTLDQAVREAVEKNFGLLAERYNVNVAEARILQARLRPNPVMTVGLDYQDALGTGFNLINNAGPPEFTARTDFPLERGGKRLRRIEVAEGARGVAQLNLLNATRTLILDVQSAFVDVQAARDNLELARSNLKSFQGIVEINEARVRAGDLAQVELIRTRVAALQFQNAVRQAESRLRIAKTRLQGLMGRTVFSPAFDATGNLRREAGPPDPAELRARSLELRPDLQALQRDQARSLSDVRLQIAQGKVDYSIGVQWHRQYDTAHGNSLGFFFAMPLPVFNRNQGEIERARREGQQIESRIRALEAQIAVEVESAWQQFHTAKDLLESIERDMLKQAQEVRVTTEYSYRRGEASFVELLDAQRAYNDSIQGYNEARAEFARSLYVIDSITGKVVNP